MSRVGKNPVSIPAGVEVKIDGAVVTAKGKLGEQSFDCGSAVKAELDEGSVKVSMVGSDKFARAMWGTARSRIQNLVTGVSEGFERKLEIVGVGYRAAMKGKDLQLQLAFSHDVMHAIPEGVSCTCESPTAITLKGMDKQLLGQVAAEIRSYRPPEPYKGKGIRYAGEYILRKEGKKK